jgi:hypothetical protein
MSNIHLPIHHSPPAKLKEQAQKAGQIANFAQRKSAVPAASPGCSTYLQSMEDLADITPRHSRSAAIFQKQVRI